MTAEPPAYDWSVLSGDLSVAVIEPPSAEEMAAERERRDRESWERAKTAEAPRLRALDDAPDPSELPGYEPGDVSLDGIESASSLYPEPQDCGTLALSEYGGIEYVGDLIIPGRIHIVAAEEGTGKTYGLYELAVRMGAAGGSFAGTWPVEVGGPVVYLSEMHADDDWRYQQDVLDALGIERVNLTGRLYRLDLGTAANGRPVLTDPDWRAWFAAWCRRRGVRLAVFDTGTGASQVDPWGKGLQEVFRDLRLMLADCPELAVVLLLHLKKPQGRGTRRISDVLGEWGRWCDVLILMEGDGDGRTKVSTHKRLRHHKHIVATRAGGLLVDPVDLTEAKGGQKVAPSRQVSDIEAHPGATFAELAELWSVTKRTAQNYVKALDTAVEVVSEGPRGQSRVFPAKQPGNTEKQARFPGGFSDVTGKDGDDRESGKRAYIDARSLSHSPDPVEDDYPASAWEADR